MAVSPVIPNCVQIRLLWVSNGQLAINVLNAQAGAGVVVNQALANSLGSAIKSAFGTNLAAQYTATTALTRVGVRDMRQANQAEFLDVSPAQPGTAVGDALPNSTSLMLTMRTALSGKSFRGRIYLPGMAETANINQGEIASAASNAALAFIAALQAALTAANLILAIASRAAELTTLVRTVFHNDGTQTSKTVSTTKAKAATLTPVTAVSQRTSLWESQRRRSNGRGGQVSLLTPVAAISF